VATVHTSGVNWQSIAAIAGVLLVFVGMFSAYIRRSIKSSVDHLADVLDARLASNEDLDKLRERVVILEERVRRQRGRSP